MGTNDSAVERAELQLDGAERTVHLRMRGTDGSVAGGPLCSLPILRASILRDADGSLHLDVEFRGKLPAANG